MKNNRSYVWLRHVSKHSGFIPVILNYFPSKAQVLTPKFGKVLRQPEQLLQVAWKIHSRTNVYVNKDTNTQISTII